MNKPPEKPKRKKRTHLLAAAGAMALGAAALVSHMGDDGKKNETRAAHHSGTPDEGGCAPGESVKELSLKIGDRLLHTATTGEDVPPRLVDESGDDPPDDAEVIDGILREVEKSLKDGKLEYDDGIFIKREFGCDTTKKDFADCWSGTKPDTFGSRRIAENDLELIEIATKRSAVIAKITANPSDGTANIECLGFLSVSSIDPSKTASFLKDFELLSRQYFNEYWRIRGLYEYGDLRIEERTADLYDLHQGKMRAELGRYGASVKLESNPYRRQN